MSERPWQLSVNPFINISEQAVNMINEGDTDPPTFDWSLALPNLNFLLNTTEMKLIGLNGTLHTRARNNNTKCIAPTKNFRGRLFVQQEPPEPPKADLACVL